MKTFKDYITENTHPHLVFVRDYSNGSDAGGNSKEWSAQHFKNAVKTHEAEFDYHADKGVGFKFKHQHQAKAFISHINSRCKELSASHDN